MDGTARGRRPAIVLAVVFVLAVALVVGGCSGAPAARQVDPPGPVVGSTAVDIPPLPDEGGRGDGAELSDWTTDNTTARPWLLDPCRPTAYPTDRQRTGFRTVSRTGPEQFDARQLALYPTPAVAAEVMAGFRRALAACETGGRPTEGSRWRWVNSDLGSTVGEEGFLAASTTGGTSFSPSNERIAVTRVGSMVFLAFAGGEGSTAELDRVAERFIAGR